jgi:dihydroneopterin aldolase
VADCLRLRGARFWVSHGVLPHERALPQAFVVDVTVWLDVARAARDDDLTATVDYRRLWNAVAEVMGGRPRTLLEALAVDIAERLLHPPVQSVEVTVRKEQPPLPGPVDACEVTVRRG